MGALRSISSVLLAAVACGLAVVAIAATWMERQLLQSDRWTQTSVQVLRDEQVQRLTAAFLADQLIDQQDAIRDALPATLRPIAGSVTTALRDTAEQVALQALRERALEDLWGSASRDTHAQFVRWLDGDAGGGGRAVRLELQPALDRLAERAGIPEALVQRAVEENGPATVTLVRAGQFEQTRRDAHRLEQAASLSLPLAVVVAVLSVLVARRRRPALVRLGLAAVLAGSVVLVAAPELKAHLVEGLVDGGAARPVAASILDLTVPDLVRAGWLTAVGGAVLAVLAFATRPGRRPAGGARAVPEDGSRSVLARS